MPTADYAVDVQDLSGSTVVADIPVFDLKYGNTLNDAGSCSWWMPTRLSQCTVANLSPGARQVIVKRTGSSVWGGYLWTAQADPDRESVSFRAEGWFSRLKHRLITDDKFYSGVEMLDIAWGLIDYTQTKTNGALGITRDGGEVASGVLRSRHWCCWERANIAQAIQDLAFADDGFDFQITPAKVWKATAPRQGSAIAHTFDTASNTFDFHLDLDATELVSEVSGTVSSTNCADVVTTSDATALSTYGLLQDAMDVSGAKRAAERTHKVAEMLAIRKTPRQQIRFRTYEQPFTAPAWDVGDKVLVTSNIGFVNYSAQSFRVISWQVEVQDNQEITTVLLDSVAR